MFELHPSIECRPVHLGHAKVGQNQIVDVGADSFERGMPIGDRIHLAVSISSDRIGNEITKERIVVNYKDARTLEASRMDVTVRATVARFAFGKGLAADWTGVHLVYLASPSTAISRPRYHLPHAGAHERAAGP